MGKHSDLPPSSSDKWLNCHGWFRLNRGIESTSSEAAEEGTRAHEALELHLTGEKTLDQLPDKEMQDYLFACAELVGLWVQMSGGELHTEVKVDFGEKFGFVDLTGTSDIVIVSQEVILVADLKYGFGQVEVKNNTQLMIYLVGAIQKFGPRPRYEIAILQPRGNHPDGPFRRVSVSVEEVKEFEDNLKQAIENNYNNGPLKVGNHCRNYCKALGVCPAAAQASLERFSSIPVEEIETTTDLDPIAKDIPLIKAWVSAVEAKLQEDLEAGKVYQSVKLVPKRPTRKWDSEVDVVALLTNFADLDTVAPRIPLSPSQAEKVLGKKVFREKIAQSVTLESSGLTLGFLNDSERRN